MNTHTHTGTETMQSQRRKTCPWISTRHSLHCVWKMKHYSGSLMSGGEAHTRHKVERWWRNQKLGCSPAHKTCPPACLELVALPTYCHGPLSCQHQLPLNWSHHVAADRPADMPQCETGWEAGATNPSHHPAAATRSLTGLPPSHVILNEPALCFGPRLHKQSCFRLLLGSWIFCTQSHFWVKMTPLNAFFGRNGKELSQHNCMMSISR